MNEITEEKEKQRKTESMNGINVYWPYPIFQFIQLSVSCSSSSDRLQETFSIYPSLHRDVSPRRERRVSRGNETFRFGGRETRGKKPPKIRKCEEYEIGSEHWECVKCQVVQVFIPTARPHWQDPFRERVLCVCWPGSILNFSLAN